jgi:uncharacterized membrane protein
MTKAEFLEKCGQHWEKIERLQHAQNLYDLEKEFHELWTDTGKDVLSHTLGKPPKNYRKKKFLKQFMEK